MTNAPAVLKLLAHDLRWEMVAALARSDHRVQELADRLGKPMNLVSYHLRQLRQAGIVHEQRSSADGRDLYCTLDVTMLAQRYRAGGAALHPALTDDDRPAPRTTPARVLFLCTRNSARSQMAEALLRAAAGPRPLTVLSAGDQPATVHPAAITALDALGLDIRHQTSKHLDSLRDQAFDYIITVCDQVREQCPVFPGAPEPIHWSIPDPVAAAGTPTERAVFAATAQQLTARIAHFLLRLDQDAAACLY
jgi:protein-tyrosine-phosphatase